MSSTEHHRIVDFLSQYIRWELTLVELQQDDDVGNDKTDDNHGLQGYQASQIVHLGYGVIAVVVGVTEVVQDHYNYHQDGITNREDVEWSSSDVLGLKKERFEEGCGYQSSNLDIELQVAHESGPVVVVVKELVYDEEGCPVCPVCVDEKREGAKLPVRSTGPVVQGGQDEHQEDLGDTQHDLDYGSPQCGNLLYSLKPELRIEIITFLNLGCLSGVIRSSWSDI